MVLRACPLALSLLDMPSLLLFALLPLTIAVHLALRVWHDKKRIAFLPGWTVLISPLYPLPMPYTIPGIIMQRGWPWLYKHDHELGRTSSPVRTLKCYVSVQESRTRRDLHRSSLYVALHNVSLRQTSVLPPRVAFYFADAKALHYITTERAFPKPIVEFYTPAEAFGPNLIVAEGAAWKVPSVYHCRCVFG